ncbi:lysine decarboxylase [Anaerosphaera aminiphila DSM 21120]|uniref:Lysine decarboxylase n=1 Tax=Anaerosphaera aminiphila DSM 21120 TaxID=1120995 RepID=A0A1M5RY24_9FIRM|nr:aminotransferase class I/II-fold pyridoxal phosphate-dependent enzyme [Anaerosphaera aminiphila]SHH31100.1 lysine decarboxylase [Anaerosphaera aminiphila DSM 21120]
MKRYIFDEVEKMKDKLVFSTPGHKSKDYFDFNYKNDVTETINTDNLLNPDGCILKSQEAVASVFGVKSSHYIVNGSTSALQIAMGLVTKPGDKVLMQRNCHKSIYNGLIINSLTPEYVSAVYNREYNLITGIDPGEIEKKLKENPNIKTVILVSPNYFGVCLRLREIADIVHRYGGYLIVDEAHGTHLQFSKAREYSAVNCGADIVVHSTHKTIPSLTQSSLLHINTDRIDSKRVIKTINLLSTTSPSYLILQSSEFGIEYMNRCGLDRLSLNEKYIEDMKEELKGKVNFLKSDLKDETIAHIDPSKILFRIDGYSGFDIVEKLFLSYNIRLEMGDLYYALALSTVADEKEDFLKLQEALEDLSRDKFCSSMNFKSVKEIKPTIKLEPREAFYRDSKEVELEQSVGKIAACIVAAYPPGIPIVSFGELITEQVVREIKDYINSGIEVIGVSNNRLEVVV